VLTNTMFYRNRFGGETRTLKDRLGTISARRPSQPLPEAETASPP